MTIERWNISEGQELPCEDYSRAFDNYSGADDRATEINFSPGTVTGIVKTITPRRDTSATIERNLLCYPSSTAGKIAVRSARYEAADIAAANPGAARIEMGLTQGAELLTALLAANPTGSTVYRLIYARLARATTESGVRGLKLPDDSELSQSIALFDAPALTLFVSGDAATPAAALALIAADGGSGDAVRFYFPLCIVTLASGYLSGGAIAAADVAQAWNGGGIAPQRVLLARPGSICSAAGANTVPTAITRRAMQPERFMVPFKVPVGGATIELDDSIDWSQRIIRVWGARTAGGNTPFESAAAGADAQFGPVVGFTKGTDGAASWAVIVVLTGAGAGGLDITMSFYQSAHVLYVTVDRTLNGTADYWWCEVEALLAPSTNG